MSGRGDMQGQLFSDEVFANDVVNPHRLLMASAGTGKTFQLANHFGGLLVSGVEPDRVLATTFTRKAAGEILDRVLGRVREAARRDGAGEEARGFLLETIQRLNPEAAAGGLCPEHCEAVLAALVRRIDRFQIRTLDAFFVRLARLFAMELRIAPEWRITDVVEERALVAEAVARVLDGLEFQERLELLRGMTRGAEKLGAERALVETVEKAEAIGRDAAPGAWRQISPLEGPSAAEVTDAVRVASAQEPPKTKAGKPDKRWSDALAKLRAMLEDTDPSDVPGDLLEDGLVKKALADDSYYSHELEPLFKDALVALARQVIVQRIDALIQRNLASEAFLQHFTEADRALRAELGAYRFEDFPRALLEGPARQAREIWSTELGYRLDARLDHLLLDEFQDTAPNQWQLLLPLAEEVLGDGTGERSFFCVGDVKQSIYGWRGGEPKLLQRMGERHPVLQKETLVKSYRSSSVVLDTVNHVFEAVETATCFDDPKRRAALDATAEWAAGFEAHETERTDLGGEARLWQARPEDKAFEAKPDPVLLLTVERVVALRAAHPEASIAVLVRARAPIARLRFLLGQHGVEASDEGGNPLTDALGVTWILALLHLADHPGDGVAALQVARSPFSDRYAMPTELVGTSEGVERAHAAASAVREALLRRGYGAFVDEHARLMAGDGSAWDERRLEQLVELALAYDERPGLRPVDFVDWVRETRVPDPTASKVKVMTIHASKGLEFDIVVLPQLGRGIDVKPPEFMDGRRSEVEPPVVATARPKKEVAQHHEQLKALYQNAERRSMVDALSGLYVALTRAVHCVEMVIPAPSKSGAATMSHGTLLAEPLKKRSEGQRDGDPEAESEAEQASLLWEHPASHPSWSAGAGDGAEPTAPVQEKALHLAASLGSRLTQLGKQRELDAPLASFFERSSDEGRELGTLVHALFEDYHWSSDDERSDVQLAAVLAPLAGSAEQKAEAIERFESARRCAAFAPLFEEPAGEYRLATERLFDVEVSEADREPLRWRGAMDRLLLRLDGESGQVTSATVVDFKTEGAASGAEVASRHGGQLEGYRQATAALFGLEPSQIECWIAWLPEPGEESLLKMKGPA